MKKKKSNKKNTLKKIKKETKKIKKELKKAVKGIEKFDPMKGIEMPDFKKQLKDFNFKLDTKCNI
jgi:hypothetical protein